MTNVTTKYEEHFNLILDFVQTYHELINCNMVDFVTKKLWENCLPDALRLELEEDNTNENDWNKISSYPNIDDFIKLTRSLSLASYSAVGNLKDIGVEPLSQGDNELKCKHKNVKVGLMNDKKLHEVEVLGNVIATLAASTKDSLVIDAGAGKAYLSTHLAENYNIPVLAIDSSQLCHKSAISRHEKLTKKMGLSRSLVRHVIEEINDETDYVKLVTDNFSCWNLNKNLFLTGLHTCGSLAHSIIRAFLYTDDIGLLCIVPCCYHLTNEMLYERNIFSKNARMLAQQSVERSGKNRSPSLFYRAVLQVVLHSMEIYDARIGRGGPLNDFPTYAKWGLSKIGVEIGKIPSTSHLEAIYQFHVYLKNKFNMFQMLRIHAAPVLEAAIVLDRVLFLQKSTKCSALAILRLFDPVLSPRRYGIVAIK